MAAGSTHTASVCNVVAKACDDIRDRVAGAAVRDSNTDAAALKLVEASLRGTSLEQ